MRAMTFLRTGRFGWLRGLFFAFAALAGVFLAIPSNCSRFMSSGLVPGEYRYGVSLRQIPNIAKTSV